MIKRKRGRGNKAATRTPTRLKGKLVPLGDAAALVRIVRDAIRLQYGGDIDRAANASGLHRNWIKRLLDPNARKQRGIQSNNVGKLLLLVGESQHEAIRACFYPVKARNLVKGYEQWMAQMLSLSSQGTGQWWTIPANGRPRVTQIKNVRGGETQRDRERELLTEHIRSKDPDTHLRLGQFIATFYHIGPRCMIAFRRILDPLIESPMAAFIEPSWSEMKSADLRSFITLGIEREELLISRDDPWERATRAVLKEHGRFARRRKPRKATGPRRPIKAKRPVPMPKEPD